MEQSQLNPTTPIPSTARDIPGRANDTLQEVRERLNETVSTFGRRASDAARYAEEQVRQNPLTALGIGFGAGVLVGALIGMLAASSQRRF